jgi:cytochrome c peroxidase
MDKSLKKTAVWPAFLFPAVFLLLLSARCSEEMHELTLGDIAFPADNPITADKAELGRKLFFDRRLSLDNSVSCADCHRPELAFTDGKAVSSGVGGILAARNAPSLLNSAYLKTVMFDGELKTLEMQVVVPIQEHSEMNMDMKQLIAKLRAVPEYREAAQTIFGRDFDPWVLTRSIAAFERTLVSQNSAFDRYWKGDKNALTTSQKRGYRLFSEELYCAKCHPAPHFTTYAAENNGFCDSLSADQGRFRVSGQAADRGKFKVPSLRNVALTAPYMHDGSVNTLKEAVDHYSKGGKMSPNRHPSIEKFTLSERDRKDLENFFNSLTDTSYFRNYQ